MAVERNMLSAYLFSATFLLLDHLILFHVNAIPSNRTLTFTYATSSDTFFDR